MVNTGYEQHSLRTLKRMRKYHRQNRPNPQHNAVRKVIQKLIVNKQFKYYVEQAQDFANLINRPTRNERRSQQRWTTA